MIPEVPHENTSQATTTYRLTLNNLPKHKAMAIINLLGESAIGRLTEFIEDGHTTLVSSKMIVHGAIQEKIDFKEKKNGQLHGTNGTEEIPF